MRSIIKVSYQKPRVAQFTPARFRCIPAQLLTRRVPGARGAARRQRRPPARGEPTRTQTRPSRRSPQSPRETQTRVNLIAFLV